MAFFEDGRMAMVESVVSFDYLKGSGRHQGFMSYVFDNGGLRSVTTDGEVGTVCQMGDAADGPLSTAKAWGSGFAAMDNDGNLIFAEGSAVRRLARNRISTMAGHPTGSSASFDGEGHSARFAQIRGLAVDAYNRLWVADENCVRLVTFAESQRDATPEADIRLAPGITVRGEVGGMYRIECREDMNAEWVLLRVVTLAQPEKEYFDFTPGAPKRFYRVVTP